MKKQRLLSLITVGVIFGIIFSSDRAVAGQVKLIANLSVKADMISSGDLKKVFLQEKISLEDGSHVEPVLERDGPVHKAFLREYLATTDEDLQTYYRVLVFTGRGSLPKELGSDAEVVAYVGRTRGAIGYVAVGSNTEGVKTLAIGEASSSGERKLIRQVEAEYPETLKQLNIGGTVRLRVTISARGNVEDVELLGGNPILGESAKAAVKQWVYAAGHSRSVAEVSIPFDAQR
jgi:TonB family protein